VRLLLQRTPPQFHMVIITRRPVPFPVARLRANQNVCDIQTDDLRFTEKETAEFFAQAQLSETHIQALYTRTEGWAACLQLASLSLRDQANIDRLTARFTGTYPTVADYLLEEIFLEQSPAVQDFLLKTSILRRLHVDVCRELTSDDNAADILDYVERTNLLLFSLDEQRQWFRYHHLFSEFLQHRLRHHHPALWKTLQMTAAQWFAQHGYFDEAGAHALASGDPGTAAALLEEHAPAMIRKYHLIAFRQWYERLPEDIVKPYALLHLHRAVLYMIQEDIVNMEQCLTDLECALPDFVQHYPEIVIQRVKDIMTALRLHYLTILHAYDQVICEGERVLQTLDPEHHEARGLIQMSLAIAFFGQGDVLSAVPFLRDGLQAVNAQQAAYAAYSISWLQMRVEKAQGRLQRAKTILHESFDRAQKAEFVPLTATVGLHTGLAEIYYEQNDLSQALEHVNQGLEYAEVVMTPGYLWFGYSVKALIYQAQGKPERAAELMRHALTGTEQTGMPERIRLVEALAVVLFLRQGNVPFATQWMMHRDLQPDEPFTHVFEYECLALATLWLSQQRYQDAIDLLTGLRQQSETRNRMESVLKIDIMHAAALDGLGERQAAFDLFEQAVVFARPEGYVRTFADHAMYTLDLLLALQHSSNPHVRAYAPTLLAASGLPSAPSTDHIPVNDREYLTPREGEILRLIAAGLSNQQIADQTFVALSTVKTHIKHLYAKLGVTNRAQATLWAKNHLD
jgi:LuxR family maltose regulon positive regulatory protein